MYAYITCKCICIYICSTYHSASRLSAVVCVTSTALHCSSSTSCPAVTQTTVTPQQSHKQQLHHSSCIRNGISAILNAKCAKRAQSFYRNTTNKTIIQTHRHNERSAFASTCAVCSMHVSVVHDCLEKLQAA
jgi:hypothetical protein